MDHSDQGIQKEDPYNLPSISDGSISPALYRLNVPRNSSYVVELSTHVKKQQVQLRFSELHAMQNVLSFDAVYNTHVRWRVNWHLKVRSVGCGGHWDGGVFFSSSPSRTITVRGRLCLSGFKNKYL